MRAGILTSFVLAWSILGHPTNKDRTSIIYALPKMDRALLVGGWNGKRWITDDEFHTYVPSGAKYSLFSAAKRIGTASGGKPALSEASGTAWLIPFNPQPGANESLIGLTGSWNALPRGSHVVDRMSARCKSIVASVLAEHGLRNARANITSATEVDIEGNGLRDLLISATCPRLLDPAGEAGLRAVAGDYSFVSLTRSGGGNMTTQVLDGRFYPRAKPNDAGEIVQLFGALDLNGDGKLEVLVRQEYYEGYGIAVFEFSNGRAHRVLKASDGA